jgi:hypothetical protein
VVPGLFPVGLGAGLALGPLSAAAMAAVPGPRAGMAAGAVNTFRQLGFAAGVAVLGAVFRHGLEHDAGKRLVGPLSSGQAGSVIAQGGDMAQLVREAYASALDLVYVVAAGFGLVGGIAVLVFVRPRRAEPAPQPERSLVGARQAP